jgi:hypothetical protein
MTSAVSGQVTLQKVFNLRICGDALKILKGYREAKHVRTERRLYRLAHGRQPPDIGNAVREWIRK